MAPKSPIYDLPRVYAPWHNPRDRQAGQRLLSGRGHVEDLDPDRANSRRRAKRLTALGVLKDSSHSGFVELDPAALPGLRDALDAAAAISGTPRTPTRKSVEMLEPGVTVLRVTSTSPDLMGRFADALERFDDVRPIWAARTRGEDSGYLIALDDSAASTSDAIRRLLGDECSVSTVGPVMDGQTFQRHLHELRTAGEKPGVA